MGPAHRMRAVLVRFEGSALRLQIMTGTAVAATLALVLVVFWADRELPIRPETGDVLRVGVVEGQSVTGYLDSSRDELARLVDPSAPVAGDTWALVAFGEYTEAGLLAGLLAGGQVAQVYTRAPVAGARTAVVRIPVYRLPADVTAGMLGAALTRDRERADYLRLSRELTGSGRNETRLRAAYETAARIAAEEAAAYRAGCACVFAAVVRGTPAVLGTIAARPRVRVVDPAPEVRQLDRTEFRPPLPEEVEVVSPEPAPAGVPSGLAGVASGPPGPLPSSIGTDVTSTSPDDSGGTPSAAVFPSEGAVAVPSATDTSPAHEGLDVSPGASSGDSGR
ncbi:hypothetical protein [Actinoplanes utahensis]|uniref:Uncharacterized protein n=1 Tax=Actinoplanes utahensis TaxID=1869 RepID=A0A0A6URN4_ACTUT|nr:hypothetical protein [Actinoplanes utahensis]KHD77673.1 hypothetical protein MB27_09335 [Actinoplanes utahensis]GIF34624.1 hypothetical protein Aut01nite_76100 [Actinoplanes utahensis]